MQKVLVGSRIPFNVSIDGLGGKLLTDSSVSLTVTFFTVRRTDYGNTSLAEGEPIDKKQMIQPDPDDQESLLCIADTTNLSTGKLYAKIEVTYMDEASGNKEVHEKIAVDTGIILYTPITV